MDFTSNLKGSTILVVDDNLLFQQQMYQVLIQCDANVISAPDAEIGLRLARKKRPDIVLMDWNLPTISGLEAIKTLKSAPTTSNIPIIMITAVAISGKRAFEALNAGADDFLLKPFDQHELIGRICAVLRLYDATAKISKQNEELQKLADEKAKLLTMISHDLKAPLNHIESLMHLLENEFGHTPSHPTIEGYTELITKIISHERDNINKTLEIYEYESKRYHQVTESIDVVELLQSVLNNYMHNDKQISIDFLSNIRKLVIESNPVYIEKIIDNLLSNAMKYSFPKSTVQVSLKNQASCIYLSVKDQGQGFHPEEVNRVFQDFGKFSAQPTGNESSTGLGLYIVKNIIKRLGGTIQLKSTYGKGSEFIVLLPKEQHSNIKQPNAAVAL